MKLHQYRVIAYMVVFAFLMLLATSCTLSQLGKTKKFLQVDKITAEEAYKAIKRGHLKKMVSDEQLEKARHLYNQWRFAHDAAVRAAAAAEVAGPASKDATLLSEFIARLTAATAALTQMIIELDLVSRRQEVLPESKTLSGSIRIPSRRQALPRVPVYGGLPRGPLGTNLPKVPLWGGFRRW